MVEPDDGPIRVLHVDDQREFVDLAAAYLERVSDRLTVVTETDAGAALDRLRSEPVDCVVSDYDMPGTGGLALLERVRERYPDLPFVLFTAKGSEEIASEAISAGVTEYLEKETGTDQYTVLANRIERAVAERRARAALGEHERRLSTLISNLPGMVYRCRNERGWPMEFVSEGAAELTGYDAAELESDAVDWSADVIAPGQEEGLWEDVQAALREREAFEVTYEIVTADSRRKWVWERGCGVYEDETKWRGGWTDSADGDPDRAGDGPTDEPAVEPGDGAASVAGLVAIEGFITDTTPREVRERESETARERYRALVETAPDPLLLFEADGGRIVDANPAASDLLGRSRSDVVGDEYASLCPDAAGSVTADTLDGTETELVTDEGDRVPVAASASRLELNGRALVQGHFRDISE